MLIKIRTCHLEKKYIGPLKVCRKGRHIIQANGILTTVAWLPEREGFVGNSKNGWTIVQISDPHSTDHYSLFRLNKWPE